MNPSPARLVSPDGKGDRSGDRRKRNALSESRRREFHDVVHQRKNITVRSFLLVRAG